MSCHWFHNPAAEIRLATVKHKNLILTLFCIESYVPFYGHLSDGPIHLTEYHLAKMDANMNFELQAS